jgi:DDE superfamily endonuclease/Transposase IS116/IS110/IS902 family
VWDHDAVRDDLRGYVIDHLGDEHAVLVVDETARPEEGHPDGGSATAVHRHRRPDRERAGGCVPDLYASAAGHAFIDRALYLPRSWTDDPDRCAQAGVPDRTPFATKPALAAQMIARAVDAGAPASWVAGDEVYGNDPQLRAMLHQRNVGYVLAVARDHRVRTHAGIRPAVDLAVTLPASVWQTRSCGPGSKGHRWYAWAMVDLDDQDVPGQARLLLRRNRTGEYAFYRCYSPTPVPMSALVAVAGRRWTVEEIGVDMAQFPTAAHLASWAGMCPGNNESAGKHFSGRTRKGDRWPGAALGEAAAAAAGTKDTYCRAQYQRLAARRGKKRALVAVGHSLLVAAWHVINDEVNYQDLGALHFLTRIDPARQTRRLVAHLQQLGYQVQLSPAASG